MSATDRKIFRFFDGRTHRAVDPLEMLRNMRRHSCDFGLADTMAHEAPDDAAKDEAWVELIAAIREVFGVEAFSDSVDDDGRCTRGLTEGETYDLLNDFGEYLDALKKNSDPKPTSPPPSELPACPGSVEPTNTNDLSDSG